MNYSAVDMYRRQVFDTVYTTRKQALFSLTDSLLCSEGPIINPAYLSLGSPYSYGAYYQGLTEGKVDSVALLRANLACGSKLS